MQQSFFSVKLYELEKQHEEMLNQIRLCQSENIDKIDEEVKKIKRECTQQNSLLQEYAKNTHSKIVSELADAQISYNQNIKEISKKIRPEIIHHKGCLKEEIAEEKMLYAEFSIDFAVQAIRNAYMFALSAIKEQKEYEEWRQKNL